MWTYYAKCQVKFNREQHDKEELKYFVVVIHLSNLLEIFLFSTVFVIHTLKNSKYWNNQLGLCTPTRALIVKVTGGCAAAERT